VGAVSSFSSYNILLQSVFTVSSIVSFLAIWFATVMFMYHYSKQLGLARYWLTVSLPLIYFMIQFQPLVLEFLSSYRESDPTSFGIAYTVFFSLSQPVGGILFAIAFWVLLRKLRAQGMISVFMLLSGCGLLLFFSSNQAIVFANYPYPPFGLSTVSYMPLSAYLVLVGIYGSAITVANDSSVRQVIRKSTLNQARVLDSMGSALMQQKIERRVMDLTAKYEDLLNEKTGIKSSLSDDEVKSYMNEVLEEVKQKTKDTGKKNNL
jgi:hypothetical protein